MERTSSSIVKKLPYRFCDIGVNLVDEMYKGMYNGKRKHDLDIETVLRRGNNFGVDKFILTGTTLSDSLECLSLTHRYTDYRLFCSVGVHPTRCSEIFNSEDEAMNSLFYLIKNDASGSERKIVAIGECGLDYDRLQFCSKEQQLVGFLKQLELAEKVKTLPLFLHNRNTGGDFIKTLSENRHMLPKGGVVHSFDGSAEELDALLELGLYIGINGCSLKTKENLDIVATIPEDRILMETDAPWCGIKASHAGQKYVKTSFLNKKAEKYSDECMVKGRNEPCTMVQVLEIVAAARGDVDPVLLSEQVYANTHRLFFDE